MTVFTVPTIAEFDALTHAANSVIRLNQRIDSLVESFIADYEDFWGVSGSDENGVWVSKGSKYTLTQMQAKLDHMGQSNAVGLFLLAGNLRDLIIGAQNQLSIEILPPRYHAPAFTMQQDMRSPLDPIVLTGLSAAWSP